MRKDNPQPLPASLVTKGYEPNRLNFPPLNRLNFLPPRYSGHFPTCVILEAPPPPTPGPRPPTVPGGWYDMWSPHITRRVTGPLPLPPSASGRAVAGERGPRVASSGRRRRLPPPEAQGRPRGWEGDLPYPLPSRTSPRPS